MAAEFSNTRRRDLSVSLMSIGYPVGAVLGGIVAAQLLRGNDWRTVFYFGAAVTAVLIPVVYFVIPESVHWLARRQPAGALDKINSAMRRMGHTTVNALPELSAAARSRSIAEIFQPGLVAITTIDLLEKIFGTTELDGQQWGICIALAASLLVVEEAIKFFLRRGSRPAEETRPAPAPVQPVLAG